MKGAFTQDGLQALSGWQSQFPEVIEHLGGKEVHMIEESEIKENTFRVQYVDGTRETIEIIENTATSQQQVTPQPLPERITQQAVETTEQVSPVAPVTTDSQLQELFKDKGITQYGTIGSNGAWASIRDDFASKLAAGGSFDLNIESDADIENVTGNILQQMEKNPNAYFVDENGNPLKNPITNLGNIPKGAQIDFAKLYTDVLDKPITIDGVTYNNLMDRAAQLTEAQVANIDQVQTAIERGDLSQMDRDTMGAGNLQKLEAQEAAARAARAAAAAAQQASVEAAQNAVYGQSSNWTSTADNVSQTTNTSSNWTSTADNVQAIRNQQQSSNWTSTAENTQQGILGKQPDQRYVTDGNGNRIKTGNGTYATIGANNIVGGDGVQSAAMAADITGRGANDSVEGGSGDDRLEDTLSQSSVQNTPMRDAIQTVLNNTGIEASLDATNNVFTLANGTIIRIENGQVVAINASGETVGQTTPQKKPGLLASIFGTIESPQETAQRLMAQIETPKTGASV